MSRPRLSVPRVCRQAPPAQTGGWRTESRSCRFGSCGASAGPARRQGEQQERDRGARPELRVHGGPHSASRTRGFRSAYAMSTARLRG